MLLRRQDLCPQPLDAVQLSCVEPSSHRLLSFVTATDAPTPIPLLTACSGDQTKICGGGQALNIFHNPAISSTPAPLANGWQNTKRCLLDGANGRLFAGADFSSNSLTQTACTDFCASKGFDLAGMEYSSQWCVSPRAVSSLRTEADRPIFLLVLP
jgi:hypothetical protein